MTDREKECLMAQPTYRDGAIPEDHQGLKDEEFAALEREAIGKALGIIIEREHVTALEAFAILKQMSLKAT